MQWVYGYIFIGFIIILIEYIILLFGGFLKKYTKKHGLLFILMAFIFEIIIWPFQVRTAIKAYIKLKKSRSENDERD